MSRLVNPAAFGTRESGWGVRGFTLPGFPLARE
jgi:hypothetical protein